MNSAEVFIPFQNMGIDVLDKEIYHETKRARTPIFIIISGRNFAVCFRSERTISTAIAIAEKINPASNREEDFSVHDLIAFSVPIRGKSRIPEKIPPSD